MDYKKIRKSISRFFGWLGFESSYLIIKVLPQRRLYSFARILSNLGYLIAVKQRRIALESLTIAFGKEKTQSEIRKIAKDCFSYIAKAAAEVIFIMDRPLFFKNKVQLKAKENLDNALAKGKGVILVSAHFGNFPLMLLKLNLEGYKTASLMRRMRDERMERVFAAIRDKMGIKAIYSQPRVTSVTESLRTLRNNELLFIPLDQNFGTGGVFVDFFGRKAATATGPVVLAQRTSAAIVPCFIVRQKDDTHTIIFEPELELKEGKSPQETLAINIQRLTVIIESYIRRYPAEWGWIHRRWKSQPA